MERESVAARIERQLEASDLHAIVEPGEGVITLSGQVASAEERQAASDIAANLAPGQRIDNNLEIALVLPEMVGELTSDGPSPSDLPDSLADIEALGGEIEPDFTDQPLLTDPVAAAGPSGSAEDAVESGDEVYYPPTDPVITTDAHGQAEVLGGFSAGSMAEIEVAPSALDGQLGDEAIADTIRQELREDALTTDLQINVLVREGVVRLRGSVPTIEDAENAEEVAARVPGVLDVVEELEVAGL